MVSLSIYNEVREIIRQYTVPELGTTLSLTREQFFEKESFSFVAGIPGLEYVTLLIENALLLRTNRSGRIHAGFGKLTRMEPVIDRYLRIADLSNRLYVFGELDWRPPAHPNLKVIPIASDSPLSQESFLISCSGSFDIALVATERLLDSPAVNKQFLAFKSTESSIVDRLCSVLEENLVSTAA